MNSDKDERYQNEGFCLSIFSMHEIIQIMQMSLSEIDFLFKIIQNDGNHLNIFENIFENSEIQ